MYKLIIYITIAIILVYVVVRSFKEKKGFKRKIVKTTRTEKILKIINVFAWIIFVGTLVKSGIILISFIISLFNPEAVVFKDIGLLAFVEVMIFLGILIVGFIYVWMKGDLDWVKMKLKYASGRYSHLESK